MDWPTLKNKGSTADGAQTIPLAFKRMIGKTVSTGK